MKKLTQALFIIIVFVSINFFETKAQKLVVSSEKCKTDESIETDSWSVSLDQDVDKAQDTFAEFIKTTFKIKLNKRTKKIYSVDKTLFPEISSLRMDIIVAFSNESAGSRVNFMFSPGYDIFLSSNYNADDFNKAQSFVKGYIRFHYNIVYTNLIEDIGNNIKKKESDIKSNENKIDKLKSSIAENDDKIKGGDPKSQELKDKNAKLSKEIDDKNAENESKRKDILAYQDDIIKTTERLKSVADFK